MEGGQVNSIAELNAALGDRYIAEREIGRGGMATVYLARDVKHGRFVALKLLDPELGALLGAERFLSEIRVTANLQHPHLLPLFDSGEARLNGADQPGLLFYVMPYVEGESLRARLEREKQLPVDEAVRLAVAVAGALAYAHERGVIHRDLKPENILLQSGQPVVSDFGIALAVSNAGGQRITQTGLSLGTPQYMSPEQATGDRALDGRTDIYSLGAVLYEMLAGDPPFTGSSAQRVIARLITEPPRDLRSHRPSVPEHVATATNRALEKLAADRFPTAAAFGEALEGKVPALVRGADTGPFAETAAGRWGRPGASIGPWRSSIVPWVIAAMFALVFGVAAWAFHRRGDAPTVSRVAWFAIGTVGDSSAITDAALSPDGQAVALAAGNGDSSRIYVRRLDELVPHPVPGSEGGTRPFFSADGRWIGFSTTDGKLERVPIAGGTPSVMADLRSPVGASWDSSGAIVTGMSEFSPAFSGLWRLSGDSAEPARLTRPAPGTMHHFPVLLPDHETVMFSVVTASGRRLALGSVRTGAFQLTNVTASVPLGEADGQLYYEDGRGGVWAVRYDSRSRRLTSSPHHLLQLSSDVTNAWLAQDGTLAYLAAPVSAQPVLADVTGRRRPLPPPGAALYSPRVSPDGRRISFAGAGALSGVYIYDVASETYARLTTGGSRGVPAEWSPDGTHVVFPRQQGRELWWQRADGSGAPERLLAAPSSLRVGPASFSPDGKWLALTLIRGDTTRTRDVVIVSLASPTTITPFVATAFDESAPAWSRDGKWIAYQSDETGKYEVYIRGFPSGERVRVSDNGGTAPIWSRDGRLLYRANDQIVAATLASGRGGAISIQRRTIVYHESGVLNPALGPFDITPDGRYLVTISSSSKRRPEVVVVVNWRDGAIRDSRR
jgi:eukaryotic-like serine/threonine-protein kinase